MDSGIPAPIATPMPAAFRMPGHAEGTVALRDSGTAQRPEILRQFELTERVHAYDPKADTSLIDAAYVLAMQAHGKQTREKNGKPLELEFVVVSNENYAADEETAWGE